MMQRLTDLCTRFFLCTCFTRFFYFLANCNATNCVPQGSKVEAIIFNADIPKMSPLLHVYKKYKITNAEVKPIPAKFQTSELTIQWVISTKTVIQEINDDPTEIMPVKFTYTKFTNLVHHMDEKNKSVGKSLEKLILLYLHCY